jgi:hypothetical protein
MKSLLTEEIANLGWLARRARPVVYEQRMLLQVGFERRQAGRIDASVRVIEVIPGLTRCGRDLIVCHDIASDQVSDAWEHDLGQFARLVDICKSIDELRGSLQFLQRYIHARHPPGSRRSRSVRNMRIDTSATSRFSQDRGRSANCRPSKGGSATAVDGPRAGWPDGLPCHSSDLVHGLAGVTPRPGSGPRQAAGRLPRPPGASAVRDRLRAVQLCRDWEQ